MQDFKTALEEQMKKAAASTAAPPKPAREAKSEAVLPAEPGLEDSETEPGLGTTTEQGKAAGEGTLQAQRKLAKRAAPNVNRVTVNLFEADRRALAVIKEFLSTAGHDFTSRSDSIKVALRLASKARPEEVARLYRLIKAEDKRFRTEE
jgi:hypothetical protein